MSSIPDDADVVVCHQGLADRARSVAGDRPVITFQVFLGDPAVNQLVKTITEGGQISG